jgi:hypothetical protein
MDDWFEVERKPRFEYEVNNNYSEPFPEIGDPYQDLSRSEGYPAYGLGGTEGKWLSNDQFLSGTHTTVGTGTLMDSVRSDDWPPQNLSKSANDMWSIPADNWGSDNNSWVSPSSQDHFRPLPGRESSFTSSPAHPSMESSGALDFLMTQTTVMIRNIPCKYSQELLHAEIRQFNIPFNFLYVPLARRSTGNLGYGFVNFNTADAAMNFIQIFQGHAFSRQPNSKKRANVSYAKLQGFQENVEFYTKAQELNPRCKPWVDPFWMEQLTLQGQ